MKKIKNYLLIIVNICCFQFSNAQCTDFDWAKRMGNSGDEHGRSIMADISGNIYTVGFFSGTVDFNPANFGIFNLTATGGTDAFVSKLDASGNFLWAIRFGSISDDIVNSIAIDNLGNICVTGMFNGSVDFDPSTAWAYLTSEGGNDIFIAKFDSSGNLIWAKNMGGFSNDEGKAVVIDASNNIYTTGVFLSTADFSPGVSGPLLTSAGGNDVFITKHDSDGILIFAKRFGGFNEDVSTGIASDGLGNLFLTGFFDGTSDFDPSTATTYNMTSAGSFDAFALRLDVSGNFIWSKQMGGLGYDKANGITTDVFGNVYSTGYFSDTADFDSGVGAFNLISNGNSDIYINKLDVAGNLQWAKAIGGNSWDISNGIAVDAIGNIYTTGYFGDVVDFNPSVGVVNLTSSGLFDAYFNKLDASGNFIWVNQIEGAGSGEDSKSIFVDISGNIYCTGTFYGTVDFDPTSSIDNLTSLGGADIFIHKMSFMSVDTSVTPAGASLSANNSLASSYQWMDCNSNAIISGETNQNFTATAGGNYAVIVTQGGCSDTSSCYSVSFVGINNSLTLKDNLIKVYPNPNNGEFAISSNNVYEYKIVNELGQAIRVFKQNSSNLFLHTISDLANGVYFLIASGGQGTYQYKIVVAKQ